MDLEAFRGLLTTDGQRVLAEACATYNESNVLAVGARLRRAYPADIVAAALTQAALRVRARAKFGADAAGMYFTPDGYEQATRAPVAAYRASRFARSGVRRVADLGCGIGADLLALARAGHDVVGVDVDPLRVEVAAANVASLGLGDHARVEIGDARDVQLSAYDAVFADPSRRTARGRVSSPDAYAPPWSFVAELLRRDACVKVAPTIPHAKVPEDVEAEWISDHGEVTEAALWSGQLRTPAQRRATVLIQADDALAPPTLTQADLPVDVPVSAPRAYLYEPDGAVIRAGLVTAVAALVDGALLDRHIAYVTSDRVVATPFAAAYRIEEVLPYDVKAIRAALRARDAGVVTVKRRGVDVDPAALRRRLRATGPNAATVVAARVGRGALALLVKPTRDGGDAM